MATTTIDIKTVEWSSNPVNTGGVMLLKVYVTTTTVDIIKSGSSKAISGQFNIGDTEAIETVLIP